KTHDGDKNLFGTGDKAHVEVDSTLPSGGTIGVTIDDESSDNGQLQSNDDETDFEKLPPGGATNPFTRFDNVLRVTDDAIFTDSAGEQDVARDNAKIVVRTLGLVSAGDNVDSTETITIGDTTRTTESITDPGTEDDGMTDDTEGDLETDKLDVLDDLEI